MGFPSQIFDGFLRTVDVENPEAWWEVWGEMLYPLVNKIIYVVPKII